jgi:hypothetical protein
MYFSFADAQNASHFFKERENRGHMLRHDVAQQDSSSRYRGAAKIRSGRNTIGDNGIPDMCKFAHTSDINRAAFAHADIRAGFVKKSNKVVYFGFSRRVVYNGIALGRTRRENDIFSRSDTGKRQGNHSAAQRAKQAAVKITVIFGNLDSKLFKRREM